MKVVQIEHHFTYVTFASAGFGIYEGVLEPVPVGYWENDCVS